LDVRAIPPFFHWYWRFVPVAVTERLKLEPSATVVSAAGWVVIVGATTVPPELELLEDDELDELELLDEELDELELLELEEELLELDEPVCSRTTALLLVTEPAGLETTTV